MPGAGSLGAAPTPGAGELLIADAIRVLQDAGIMTFLKSIRNFYVEFLPICELSLKECPLNINYG